MRFLNPAGLWALLLAVPILLLYMLRLHRREVKVPSTLLWRAVMADRHANRPWQRLRRNWLLLLQLLILLTIVLALARPAVPAPMAVHGRVIILLDASASMQAGRADGTGTRFDAALRALRRVAATLRQGDRVALIAVGSEPHLLVRDGDAADLRRALDDAVPEDGPADWRTASALAAGLAFGGQVTTLLVTDAALDTPLPALPGEVQLIAVGDDAPNVGIVAFALRYGGNGVTAFARLHNAGPTTTRTLALYADGVLVERRTLTLPADGDLPLTFPDIPITAWAEIRLEEADALAVDNRAWVALGGAEGEGVLLITAGNRFLAQALQTLPGITLIQGSAPAEAAPSVGVMVVDGPVTTTLPALNGWYIAPNGGTPCGEPGETVTPTTAVRGRWTHPLLRYVDWADVHVARARRYTPPADAQVLIESTTGPLLWIVERPALRVACLAFDLHDSDLPLRPAFPILTANLVGWLMPRVSTEPIAPYPAGRPWTPLLPPDTTSAVVIAPDGSRHPPAEAPHRAGLYRIEAQTASGTRVSYAALALLDEGESDLRPRPVRVGERQLPPRTTETPGWRDLSRRVTFAALLLLLLEAALWWRPWVGRGPAFTGPTYPPTPRRGEWRASLRRVLPHLRRRPSPPVVLRLVLIALLAMAGSGFRLRLPTREMAVVFLLDRSASTQASWEAQVAYVEAALAHKQPQDRAALVVFGREAWVDRPLSPAPTLHAIATLPRADATNIEEAVRLGLALLPEGLPARLVLVTDGLETQGRADWALREAQARGVDVMVVPVEAPQGAEVWLSSLRLPDHVYPGDRVPVLAEVRGNTPQVVRLTWSAAGQAGQELLTLTAERGTVAFSFTADASGFVPLRVCLEGEADTFSQNNCADGWVMVEGVPRILVVGEAADRAALVRALRRAGLTVEERTPEMVPRTLQGLADYAAVVLVNTPARAFAPQTLEAVRGFVRDLGGGLLTIGGPSSYGVGGWLGTPLEEALPVEMVVRDPRRFPPLAMVIVIDKSGSMGVTEGGRAKIRLAAEAAIRAAEALNDTDVLAVVAYDDRPADVIGPLPMTEREVILTQLQRLQAGGGGIYVRESLHLAAELVAEAAPPGAQRHILLLADGSDAEHQEGVAAWVPTLTEAGTTLSVIAIGRGSDVPFLKHIADLGEGRFYLTERAADLPAIFAEETAQAKRSYIVEEDFYPQVASAWPPVAAVTRVPVLHGYVATTPKGAAQVVWEATQGDPLLATWQYGLGRAVAWTSDATGRWAAGWVGWEAFSAFWGRIVREILPPPADPTMALRVRDDGERARIVVDVGGGEADGLSLTVQVAQPGGDLPAQAVPLRQTAPGRYEGTFVPPQGAVLLRVHGDRHLTTGWAMPPSPEYVPGDAEAATARLAAVVGGRPETAAEAPFARRLRGWKQSRPLGPLLTLLAALMWPVDIAWRRLAFTRADVRRWWAALRGVRLPAPRRESPEPTPATLASALRRRRRGRASASDAPPTKPPPTPPPAPPPAPRARPSPRPRATTSDETLAARLRKRVRRR